MQYMKRTKMVNSSSNSQNSKKKSHGFDVLFKNNSKKLLRESFGQKFKGLDDSYIKNV